MFIVDKLVKALGNGGPVEPKILNDVAKVTRIVLYSKGVGGKKDKKAVDDEDLDFRLREMKCRMTWTIVNYIQNTANVGTQTVCFGDDIRVVNKPYWMESGFTEKKHISAFYSKNKRRKTTSKKRGEECRGRSHREAGQ